MRYINALSLNKTYYSGLLHKNKTEALQNVTFDVDEGEILAVLGINGSGKSTLVKVLLSLTEQTKGRFDLFETTPILGKWKGLVGYLPENFRCRVSLTPQKFLSALGAINYLKGGQLAKRIDQVLSDVGLSDSRTRSISEFSKGMLQRLGIAQSILHNPRLLFLDEPTDGLDPAGRKLIRDMLLNWKKEGRSIVLNSHLLSEIELIADRVMILHKGKVMAWGGLSDLLPSDYSYCVTVSSPILGYDAIPKNGMSDGQYTYQLIGNHDLSKFTQRVCMAGININSIIPQKESLEDVFLRNIKD